MLMHRVAIEMDARTESLAAMAEFIDRALGELQAPKEVVHKLTLSLDEAVTNVASYAYPEGGGKMSLTIESDGELFRARLTDHGRPFNPLEQPEPDLNVPIEERKIGGLGIHLIRKMADEFRYNRINDTNELIIGVRRTTV